MKKFFIAMIMLSVVLAGCALEGEKKEAVITIEEASVKALDFINENLMAPGSEATVKETIEEGDMYKITVNLPNGQDVDTYITKDGEKFFPQVFNLNEEEKQPEENTSANKPADSTVSSKNDKPEIELFVMSHCPYGAQIEKGILPALEALGDKVDFELRFCDYAMHGEKELNEELEQYCVQKEAPDKLFSYLNCFLASGDEGDACFSEVGIDKSKIDSCVASADSQFKVTENFKDKSTWKGNFPTFNIYKSDVDKYSVGGSPTLIINGNKISAARDSASLLATICSAFNNAPDECSKQLSPTSPSPGFGAGASGGGSAQGCGQ